MIFLGISQDRFDCGATITDGQRVLYAANEERFTRQKHQGGMPTLALAHGLRVTGLEPADIDRVCIAGIMTPPLPARAFPALQRWLSREELTDSATLTNQLTDLLAFRTSLAHTSEASPLRRITRAVLPAVVRRNLDPALRRQPISFVDHHRSHAIAACHLSGFEDALCITADGMGDGLSLTVSRWSGGALERLWTAASLDSLGLFYEVVTEALGFIPNRHEGKVTGLAADGNSTRVKLSSPFEYDGDRLRYRGPHGRAAVAWARQALVADYSREDVAAWLQQIVEDNLLAIARRWLRQTGADQLVVGGGLFANVKLNQRLHELDEVARLFVNPNMGDGGQSLGAICDAGGLPPQAPAHVFWGGAFGDEEIAAALRANRMVPGAKDGGAEETIARLLGDGHLVARFHGAMEWGPRALGNRSVLAPANDPSVVVRLNHLLERSEFMPFAPAMRDEDADSYLVDLDRARHAAQFMTVCFDATARMRAEYPAVVHVDGTVRPQLVRRDANPSFHRILSAYKDLTGHAMVLNTSFNIHEEPIVRTPQEAISTFVRAGIDYLALGSQLMCSDRVRSPLRQADSVVDDGKRTAL